VSENPTGLSPGDLVGRSPERSVEGVVVAMDR